jgi:hypothetical protein
MDFPETVVRDSKQIWSQPSQGKRRLNLKGGFGHLDHGGESPVLTITAHSYGHVARGHDQQLCCNLI